MIGQTHGVRPTTEIGAAKFTHVYKPLILLKRQRDDSVTHKLQVVIGRGSTSFGGKENSSSLLDEKTQKGEYLFAELKRVAGKKPELGHGVEKDSLRLQLLDLLQKLLSDRFPFDFSGRKDVVALHFCEKCSFSREIQKVHMGQIKAERLGIGLQFTFRFP